MIKSESKKGKDVTWDCKVASSQKINKLNMVEVTLLQYTNSKKNEVLNNKGTK